jgi:hypothetical protein
VRCLEIHKTLVLLLLSTAVPLAAVPFGSNALALVGNDESKSYHVTGGAQSSETNDCNAEATYPKYNNKSSVLVWIEFIL